MNKRPFSRLYSLLVLSPIPLATFEYLEANSKMGLPLVVSIVVVITGSLLIILGEPKHHS
jgi:hypothetical protein